MPGRSAGPVGCFVIGAVLRPLPTLRLLFLTLIVGTSLLAPVHMSAQQVRGTAVEAGSARPIEGAFVSLQDQTGQAVASALTGSDGTFLLHALTQGRYRLRVERIGYETWTSEPFDAGPGRTVTQRLVVPVQAVDLVGLQVAVKSQCGSRSGGGEELLAVWEEARKALQVARWTQDQELIQYDLRTWERELDASSLKLLKERRHRVKRAGRTAFLSAPAEELAAAGYVRKEEDGAYRYFAPDADVLLSDTFQRDHCFRLETGEGERLGQVGLSFEPAERGRVTDVAGVLWVEESSAELRDLEFRYVDLDVVALPRGARARGQVEFRRLPTGPWFVRRWWIRMPLLGEFRVRARRQTQSEVRAYAYTETGGEVAGLALPGGQSEAVAEWGMVAGTVYDSLKHRPLAGAEVYLMGTDHLARTDGEGRYRLAGVPEGEYLLSFSPPNAELFEGMLETRPVSVRSKATISVNVALPSPATLASRLCPDTVPQALPAAALGVVRNAETGEPVPGARVWFLGAEHGVREARSVTDLSEALTRTGFEADESGVYRACGLPGEGLLMAEAETEGAASDTVWAETPADHLLRLDLEVTPGQKLRARFGLTQRPLYALGEGKEAQEPGTAGADGAVLHKHGTATLLGVVRSAETGRPLTAARVSLPDLDVADMTSGHGTFRLDKLPAGRYRLAAEYLGFSSDTVEVELRSAGGTYVTLALQTEPIPLPGLEVEVARPLSPKLVGFYDRMHKGLGDFITKEDLELRDVVSNFRRIPNVRVVQCLYRNGSGKVESFALRKGRCWEVQISRGYVGLGTFDQCKPIVYLDGHQLIDFINTGGKNQPQVGLGPFNVIQTYPRDFLEGIEVYRNPGMAPAQYRVIGDLCGIIMVWTKGRGSR